MTRLAYLKKFKRSIGQKYGKRPEPKGPVVDMKNVLGVELYQRCVELGLDPNVYSVKRLSSVPPIPLESL